jgi:hypothetical protein
MPIYTDGKYIEKGTHKQVEPNHLSAMRTGEIYAQLPAAQDMDNGVFAKYNYAENKVDFAGAGEWMLHFSEVKVYGPRETDADFYIAEGQYPKLFKTHEGDIFTTDNVKDLNGLKEGDVVAPGADGILAKVDEGAEGMVWQVVKVYDLADGTPAVKVMRIQ